MGGMGTITTGGKSIQLYNAEYQSTVSNEQLAVSGYGRYLLFTAVFGGAEGCL